LKILRNKKTPPSSTSKELKSLSKTSYIYEHGFFFL
jgi:hypothetical protein